MLSQSISKVSRSADVKVFLALTKEINALLWKRLRQRGTSLGLHRHQSLEGRMKGFDVFPESSLHRHIFMLERVGGKPGADGGSNLSLRRVGLAM